MEPLFIKKLKDVIREQVAIDNSVQIDGIGKFYKVHHNQTQKKAEDGSVVIMPPKDSIEFKSQINLPHDD
ncbi:hypothetical protein DYD21_02035 [Rhodohalobacter sp. SW132]|uniref:hypothetical protein n=1 Tax=Rhodohalobacter sp. SW132 TaxID=2293433 RepID=UPI000E26C9E9|nr:hypothetical protein [Rhodohalobacter sp. SW132]REL38753.1 hypothetical protein DYD21_02035 [Rhodohalobacter sp. SW132]